MNAMGYQMATSADVLSAGRPGPVRQAARGAVAGRCREAIYLGVIGLAIVTLWSSAPASPPPEALYIEATPFVKQYLAGCRRAARSADANDDAAARWPMADARPVDPCGFAPDEPLAGQAR